MLQSVFIIRSFNDTQLKENGNIQLVAASLVASLFSISNKYTWLDKEAVAEGAKTVKFRRGCPCISPYYVLRIIWRFSFVATRFCIFSLVWSVLGGEILGIFLAISFCIWCIPFAFKEFSLEDDGIPFILWISCTWATASLISAPATNNLMYVCIHGWEMVLSLTLITIFAYNEFDCGICADPYKRQADNNPYIKMFIIAGWITMVIDFVAYGLMVYYEIIKDDGWGNSFELFGGGLTEMKEADKKDVEMGQGTENEMR